MPPLPALRFQAHVCVQKAVSPNLAGSSASCGVSAILQSVLISGHLGRGGFWEEMFGSSPWPSADSGPHPLAGSTAGCACDCTWCPTVPSPVISLLLSASIHTLPVCHRVRPVSFANKPVVPLWFAFVALFSIPWCSSLPCSLSSSPIPVYNTHVCSFHLQVLSKIHVESEPHACLCRLSFWLKAGCVYQGAPTLPHAGSGSEYSGLCGPPQVLLPIVATLSPSQLLNSTRLECLRYRKTGVGFAFSGETGRRNSRF